jgi:hypothetical protein
VKFIYMNHRIKKPRPDGPVIVCQEPTLTREANAFALVVDGRRIGSVRFRPVGLAACPTHDVKAWVELEDFVQVQRRGNRDEPMP